jgi:hypothetical protein
MGVTATVELSIIVSVHCWVCSVLHGVFNFYRKFQSPNTEGNCHFTMSLKLFCHSIKPKSRACLSIDGILESRKLLLNVPVVYYILTSSYTVNARAHSVCMANYCVLYLLISWLPSRSCHSGFSPQANYTDQATAACRRS